jgi:hypothetical protein
MSEMQSEQEEEMLLVGSHLGVNKTDLGQKYGVSVIVALF